MFPDGNFCCPAKGVLDVLLCAQTKCLQGYEGAGKGKEDGAGVLVIVTGFLTAPSLGLHSLGSGMFSSLMGAGKCL